MLNNINYVISGGNTEYLVTTTLLAFGFVRGYNIAYAKV